MTLPPMAPPVYDPGNPARYAGLDLLASAVMMTGPDGEVVYATPPPKT